MDITEIANIAAMIATGFLISTICILFMRNSKAKDGRRQAEDKDAAKKQREE